MEAQRRESLEEKGIRPSRRRPDDHDEHGRRLFLKYRAPGIDGIYHHVGKQYLDQYLREFDFRYNVRKMNDKDRAVLAIKQTSGKRLMLKQPRVM